MGSTAEIVAEARCPIAYHPDDQKIVDRSHNGLLNGIGVRGRIMSRFFSNAKFDSINADIQMHDGMALADYGCNATVVATPGHTPGSISIVTPEGDAIIGDVIMGGYIGGNVWSTRPNYHYFADDIEQAMKSLDTLLSRTNRTLYVGHGGPLLQKSVLAWRTRQRTAR
jgi:glyoxylase-like metal-dependent hydrolase (beta-lactamase superfamily II)